MEALRELVAAIDAASDVLDDPLSKRGRAAEAHFDSTIAICRAVLAEPPKEAALIRDLREADELARRIFGPTFLLFNRAADALSRIGPRLRYTHPLHSQ